ncbi:HdeD family acid-resistance protein [Sphingomonas adhaesiva]|uniref:HdeD family acid-resistance protein n=1 Tax=Sphingomonas adhaesiva TaxID=28212 RepID=UPI002FF717C2
MTDMRTDQRPVMGAGWGWIMAYGVVSSLVGLAAFLWPFAATFAATVTIGAFFFISGVFAIAAGLFGHGHDSRAYSVVFGLVSVIAGAVMVLEPATGAISLTLMVAIWLAVRGALEVYWGFRARRRGLMIVLGVVNLLLAVFIVATVPWSALTLPGFILGTSFLMGGIVAIAAGWDHRSGAAPFAMPT